MANNRTYTVKRGDSWESIAGSVYGDQRMFATLQGANGNINMLHPGDVIRLPKQVQNPYISQETMDNAYKGTSATTTTTTNQPAPGAPGTVGPNGFVTPLMSSGTGASYQYGVAPTLYGAQASGRGRGTNYGYSVQPPRSEAAIAGDTGNIPRVPGTIGPNGFVTPNMSSGTGGTQQVPKLDANQSIFRMRGARSGTGQMQAGASPNAAAQMMQNAGAGRSVNANRPVAPIQSGGIIGEGMNVLQRTFNPIGNAVGNIYGAVTSPQVTGPLGQVAGAVGQGIGSAVQGGANAVGQYGAWSANNLLSFLGGPQWAQGVLQRTPSGPYANQRPYTQFWAQQQAQQQAAQQQAQQPTAQGAQPKVNNQAVIGNGVGSQLPFRADEIEYSQAQDVTQRLAMVDAGTLPPSYLPPWVTDKNLALMSVQTGLSLDYLKSEVERMGYVREPGNNRYVPAGQATNNSGASPLPSSGGSGTGEFAGRPSAQPRRNSPTNPYGGGYQQYGYNQQGPLAPSDYVAQEYLNLRMKA